tara:strand:+ start:1322 stop:1465 length:144 start_codon:yes stop_codon:yes gene_type:complete
MKTRIGIPKAGENEITSGVMAKLREVWDLSKVYAHKESLWFDPFTAR